MACRRVICPWGEEAAEGVPQSRTHGRRYPRRRELKSDHKARQPDRPECNQGRRSSDEVGQMDADGATEDTPAAGAGDRRHRDGRHSRDRERNQDLTHTALGPTAGQHGDPTGDQRQADDPASDPEASRHRVGELVGHRHLREPKQDHTDDADSE